MRQRDSKASVVILGDDCERSVDDFGNRMWRKCGLLGVFGYYEVRKGEKKSS